MVQRVFKFVAAPADKFFWCNDRKLVVGANAVAGLFGGLSVDSNLTGEDESLGFFATVAQALFNKSLIEARHI
jgi:hypothetical protein